MTFDLKSIVVRILDTVGDTVGAGFVLNANGLIATCAHVVHDAGSGPGKTVNIVFLHNGQPATATVLKGAWRSPESIDIAILQVDSALPKGIAPLPLGSSLLVKGHAFETFGFPDSNPVNGIPGQGTFLDRTTLDDFNAPVITVRSQEVTGGYSGGPVFDTTEQHVVGMVTAIPKPDKQWRQLQTAFITPVEDIVAAYPALVDILQPNTLTEKIEAYKSFILEHW